MTKPPDAPVIDPNEQALADMRAMNRKTVAAKHEAAVASIQAPTAAIPALPASVPPGYSLITLLDGRQVPVSDDHEAIELRNRLNGPVKAIIVVGPPKTAFFLALPKIFAKHVSEDGEMEFEAQLAQSISYVRSINGRDLPDPLIDWQTILAVTHELGDLGVRAVRECVAMNWPQGGSTFWSSVKKNLPL